MPEWLWPTQASCGLCWAAGEDWELVELEPVVNRWFQGAREERQAQVRHIPSSVLRLLVLLPNIPHPLPFSPPLTPPCPSAVYSLLQLLATNHSLSYRMHP